MSRACFAAVALVALHAFAGAPALAQVGANGFVVKHDVTIDAPAARVYEILVKQVGRWWNPEHTFSGDPKNLSIDARPGGCFCEKLSNGGGLEHMRVVYVAPGEMVRMSGGLGPLQGSGLAGSLTLRLTGASGGTRVELTYAVGGYLEGGFEGVAPAVSAVLGDQLRRLELFTEDGRPTAQ